MSGLQSCISSIKSNASQGEPADEGLSPEQLEAFQSSIEELASVISEMNDLVQSISDEERDGISAEEKAQPEPNNTTATTEGEGGERDDEEKYKTETKESEEKDEEGKAEKGEDEKENEEEEESKDEEEKKSDTTNNDEVESKVEPEVTKIEVLREKVMVINTKLMDWAKRIEVAAERCETLQPVLSA